MVRIRNILLYIKARLERLLGETNSLPEFRGNASHELLALEGITITIFKREGSCLSELPWGNTCASNYNFHYNPQIY